MKRAYKFWFQFPEKDRAPFTQLIEIDEDENVMDAFKRWAEGIEVGYVGVSDPAEGWQTTLKAHDENTTEDLIPVIQRVKNLRHMGECESCGCQMVPVCDYEGLGEPNESEPDVIGMGRRYVICDMCLKMGAWYHVAGGKRNDGLINLVKLANEILSRIRDGFERVGRDVGTLSQNQSLTNQLYHNFVEAMMPHPEAELPVLEAETEPEEKPDTIKETLRSLTERELVAVNEYGGYEITAAGKASEEAGAIRGLLESVNEANRQVTERFLRGKPQETEPKGILRSEPPDEIYPGKPNKPPDEPPTEG
jgi:hypothetical protein